MKLLVKSLIFGAIILAIDIPWILLYMKGLYQELFNKLNLSLMVIPWKFLHIQ